MDKWIITYEIEMDVRSTDTGTIKFNSEKNAKEYWKTKKDFMVNVLNWKIKSAVLTGPSGTSFSLEF